MRKADDADSTLTSVGAAGTGYNVRKVGDLYYLALAADATAGNVIEITYGVFDYRSKRDVLDNTGKGGSAKRFQFRSIAEETLTNGNLLKHLLIFPECTITTPWVPTVTDAAAPMTYAMTIRAVVRNTSTGSSLYRYIQIETDGTQSWSRDLTSDGKFFQPFQSDF